MTHGKPATLTPGAYWKRSGYGNVYVMRTSEHLAMIWIYAPESRRNMWGISYNSKSPNEDHPYDMFPTVHDAMQYAETRLIFA